MQIKNYALIGTSAIAGLGFVIASASLHADDRAANREAPKISMEEISKQMAEKYNGTVTEIELDREWTGDYYELEIRGRDGYEYDVEVDANSGELVKEEREREDW